MLLRKRGLSGKTSRQCADETAQLGKRLQECKHIQSQGGRVLWRGREKMARGTVSLIKGIET